MIAGMRRRLVRTAADVLVAGAAIGLIALTATRVGAFTEPHVDGTGPDQQAQVVAAGRQVLVVGPAQVACQGGSGRLQIRATLSQASTGAFGEGTLDLACPQAGVAWRLTVDASSGSPTFSHGAAQASLVYPLFGEQWLGELTLADQLPSDNPAATAFRDRLGGPWWLVIVLAVVIGVLLLGNAALLIRRRRRTGAAA